MHWTRSLRRFAEQQHLASRYVLLTSRKISGPDLLVAQALADVATIGILHQRGLVHADLPGVDPASVDVSVDGGILTVTAQRSERTEHDVQWLSSERFTGGYLRRLSLGQDIDADHIAATYHNGVLTVTLSVTARAKPRRIEISHGAREETKIVEPSDSSDQHTTT
ncbi:MAG: Hsp20/alpha crystallin family protein [Mycobacterium sp.]